MVRYWVTAGGTGPEFAGGGRVGGGLVGGEGRHFQTGGQLCYHQVTLGCGVGPGEELVAVSLPWPLLGLL